MSRFYCVDLMPSLFGDVAMVRTWGRIGTMGRVRVDLFPSMGEAEVARARLVASKMAKGYGFSSTPRQEIGIRRSPVPEQREMPFFAVVA